MKTFASLLGLFVSIPIWYYLVYQILIRVHATELMMFLFWIYVPVTLLVQILLRSKND